MNGIKFFIALLFFVFLSSCASLQGKQETVWTPDLVDYSQRSSEYLELLERHTRVGELYDGYKLRVAVAVVRLSGNGLQSAMKKEMAALYGKSLPNGAISLLDALYPLSNCESPLLIRAWDGVRREDPLEATLQTWKFSYSGRQLSKIKGIVGRHDVLNEFIPLKIRWGQWRVACQSLVSEPMKSPSESVLRVSTPTGSLRITWDSH